MKILIADNTKDTEDVLGKILYNEGYECVFIKDGSKVIDEVYNKLPDIIILDARLKKPSALEILEKLKSAPSTRDIQVFLIASGRSHQKLAKGYKLGATDYISKPFFKEELLTRICNITVACKRVSELERLLVRDYLTGLYNRKFFMERFVEEMAWAIRYGEPLSLMILDIDHFKRINDIYGHSCGDEVLKKIAKIMLSAVRQEDIVARYGGEEFSVLLPNTCIDGAATTAERLRLAVENSDISCEPECKDKLTITISIGVTMYDGMGESSVDTLIGQADAALYEAKNKGRNMIALYSLK